MSARSAPASGSWVLDDYTADVSVVIVNYNTCAMLERTLGSLVSAEHDIDIETVVVDNASSDGSAEMVRAEFPSVVCIANRENSGHSGGCNQGMAAARGRHLFLLNSDTIVPAGALDPLVRYLDAHPEVGAVSGRVLNADGSLQGTIKSFPTPLAALFGRYSVLTRLFPNNAASRRYLAYKERDFSKPFPADSVSACAIMVRREAIEAAGPMDERYFLYWNDVDWCRSLWESGYEVHCVPESSLVHDQHKGGTRAGPKRILMSTMDFHLGAYEYYRKWHVKRAWSVKNALAIVGLASRALLVMAAEQVRWALGVDEREA